MGSPTQDFANEDKFTVRPRRVPVGDALSCRWSIYVIRVDLARYREPPAIKIGMVGTATIAKRLTAYRRDFGPTELIDAWTVSHAAQRLDEIPAWRLTEQFEARLQLSAEFVDPAARLRRLNPRSGTYSYEWFEDDPRVVEAVERYAPLPLTLPHGWTLAADPLLLGVVPGETASNLEQDFDGMASAINPTDTLALPEVASFDADEQMLARACVGWARRAGTMFQGRLLEAHVAGVLDAEWPETAISAWDLRFEGIRLQVRSAAKSGTVGLTGADGVDVYVFVEKPTEPSNHSDLHYFVLGVTEVRQMARKQISLRRLAERYSPCSRSELADQIRAAYQHEGPPH